MSFAFATGRVLMGVSVKFPINSHPTVKLRRGGFIGRAIIIETRFVKAHKYTWDPHFFCADR